MLKIETIYFFGIYFYLVLMASNFSLPHASPFRQRLFMPEFLRLSTQEVQITINYGYHLESVARGAYENRNDLSTFIIDEVHPNDLPILLIDEVHPILSPKNSLLEFPTKIYNGTDDNCSICFEKPTRYYLLNCYHIFCDSCLEEWYYQQDKKTCPLCRADLKPNTLYLID